MIEGSADVGGEAPEIGELDAGFGLDPHQFAVPEQGHGIILDDDPEVMPDSVIVVELFLEGGLIMPAIVRNGQFGAGLAQIEEQVMRSILADSQREVIAIVSMPRLGSEINGRLVAYRLEDLRRQLSILDVFCSIRLAILQVQRLVSVSVPEGSYRCPAVKGHSIAVD